MTSKELEALPPEAYSNPSLFRTLFDDMAANGPDRQAEAYQKGIEVGTEFQDGQVSIGANSVWSAGRKGVSLQSYEKIGYHARTASFLAGLLASPAKIVVYRYEREPYTLKERS